ncbi:MAG TPA: phosphatase PAP2 family protein [Chloroflexota bacterium]|nr:phosphatase PAP2 family protein [Chloroflexota bacterium]
MATVDPRVDAAGDDAWGGWAREVAAREPERVAGFGLALVLGFVSGVAALVGFAWLSQQMLGHQTQQLDDATLAALRQFSSPLLEVVARGASLLGSEVVLGLGVVLLIVFGWQRRWGAALGLLMTTAGAQMLNDLLKELFQRTRPAPLATGPIAAQTFSFPSGHAMVAAAFYFFLAYLAWRMVRGAWRPVLVVGLLSVVLLIGLARLYLAAHFLSDVIAGYFAGFLWTDAVITGGRLLTIHAGMLRR